MTDDNLRELATSLPHDRPTAERAERVRASLLAEASVPATPRPRRWLLVGGGFAAGALAAAALAVVLLRGPSPAPRETYARIESSAAAAVDHTVGTTASGGTDEIVRVRAGTVRLAVPAPRAGDRVRVATADAELEGAGEYEVVVAGDALSRVTVTAGRATLRLAGKHDAVFLAAGQTWRAAIQTAELLPAAPTPAPAAITADPRAPESSAAAPSTSAATAPTSRADARAPADSMTPTSGATAPTSRIDGRTPADSITPTSGATAPTSRADARAPANAMTPTSRADARAPADSITPTSRAVTPTSRIDGRTPADSITPTSGATAPTSRTDARAPANPVAPTSRADARAPANAMTPTSRADARAPANAMTPTSRADARAPADSITPTSRADERTPGPVATAPSGGAAAPSAAAPSSSVAAAPGTTPPRAVSPAGAPPQITADAARVAPVAKPASEVERRFRAGTALLRANKLAEAVVELGAAADAGDTPLAADARYFQAVALVKAKRGAEAERALVRFLDRAPSSIRRGRAAMMLGRLLADRGDAKTARAWFTVAANDPDATVAAAANAALRE